MQPLEETQREFFSALMMPLRGRSRDSTELPSSSDGHSSEFLAKAEVLMKPSANLTAAESLELYHRQYWFRVLDSIEEDFPITKKLAGEAVFWELIEAYLIACPSSSFTLRHLGGGLADFIANWDVLDDTKRRWFSSLARIEYAYMEIYEAAEWKSVTPEEFASAELGLQPYVKLLELPVPADLCVDWDDFNPTEDMTTHLAVWRGANGEDHQIRMDPTEYLMLKRLQNGGSLESLFAEPTDREPSPEEVSSWFSNWQSRGWIALSPDSQTEDFAVVQHRVGVHADWSGVDKMGSQARFMED